MTNLFLWLLWAVLSGWAYAHTQETGLLGVLVAMGVGVLALLALMVMWGALIIVFYVPAPQLATWVATPRAILRTILRLLRTGAARFRRP